MVRREVVWPVSVVVDIGTRDLLVGGDWGGPTAQTGGGTIGKRHGRVTVLDARDRRSATGATIEPSDAERASAGRKKQDDGRGGSF